MSESLRVLALGAPSGCPLPPSRPRGVATDDLPEDHVLPIQVRCGLDGDEELGAIGVRPRVGHGQQTWVSHRAVEEGARGTEDTSGFGVRC